MKATAITCIALVWCRVALGQNLPIATNDPAETTARSWADQDRLNQANNIEIDELSFRKGGFRNALIASFVLRNDNKFGVRDIRIICVQTKPDGTILSTTERTFYRALKAEASLPIPDFNMGPIHPQASQRSCRVAGTAVAFE